MSNSYNLPLAAAEVEFTEKKSRFISSIKPVSSEEEALDFLRTIREKHREATHNVFAYRIFSGGACRHSDDGEPSGTAGMPLLDVFLKRDIYDFCCVATRYFGGIKLGAGGLVRAYARCGSDAMDAAGTGLMREMALCTLDLPYPIYEQVKRLLVTNNIAVTSEDFGTLVTVNFSIIEEELPNLDNKLREMSAGTIDARIMSRAMMAG